MMTPCAFCGDLTKTDNSAAQICDDDFVTLCGSCSDGSLCKLISELKKPVAIVSLGGGWYDFTNVPQRGYIQVHALRCLTDRKAINQAKRLNQHHCYVVEK